jgi:hypothetical protein
MTSSKKSWGGKREGAGSGGSRPGAGRPSQIARLRKGDHVITERQTIGGEIQKPQLWKIISIGGDDGAIVEFQCGDDIITFRSPDNS